jgi:hypothetical protein
MERMMESLGEGFLALSTYVVPSCGIGRFQGYKGAPKGPELRKVLLPPSP